MEKDINENYQTLSKKLDLADFMIKSATNHKIFLSETEDKENLVNSKKFIQNNEQFTEIYHDNDLSNLSHQFYVENNHLDLHFGISMDWLQHREGRCGRMNIFKVSERGLWEVCSNRIACNFRSI